MDNTKLLNIVEKIITSNNSNDAITLKESAESIINSHITSLKTKDELKKMNFGDIKDIFEYISSDLFKSNEGRKIIHKFIKEISENKSLLNLYILHENITNSKLNDKSFISESLALLKNDIVPDSYKNGMSNLSKIVESGIKKLNYKNLDEIFKSKNSEINEAMHYVTMNKKTLKNLPLYEAKVKILANATIDNVDDTSNDNVNESVNINNDFKKAIFNEYKKDCVNIIDKLNESSNNENANKLNEIKDKLLKKEYNISTIDYDLCNLIELKNTLIKDE